ncbi:MAG: hypothetical protein ACYDHX_13045 [Methanothrix sp.]
MSESKAIKKIIRRTIDLKRVLVCILLLLLCISVNSVSAETISAQIDSFDFPSGDWYRGSNQGGANVWIKNTGDVGHLFWVSYEVMDRRGQWYSAPPEPVYAEPGDSTYFVNPVWHIPDDAQLGSYQADLYLYSYYDSSTGELSEQLDQVDQVSAFSVVG